MRSSETTEVRDATGELEDKTRRGTKYDGTRGESHDVPFATRKGSSVLNPNPDTVIRNVLKAVTTLPKLADVRLTGTPAIRTIGSATR